MQQQWQEWLSATLGDPKLSDFKEIQSLWSGYGTCCRFYSAQRKQSLVAKVIMPRIDATHPRGWQSSHSHQRKLRSYNVESHFYRHYQPMLSDGCYAPQLIASESAGDQQLLILEDLTPAGFPDTMLKMTPEQTHVVLRWLANYHARFMHTHDSALWKSGGYWHLGTRQQEWEIMEEGELKQKAKAIDTYLSDCRFKSLVHGDAKIANFCFSTSGDRCAAVDFQYCGHGIGVIDVAYFLGSALSESELIEHTDDLLDAYFCYLREALLSTPFVIETDAIIAEWRQAYPVACADFCRFLTGWSPQHAKLNRDLHARTCYALTIIGQ